MSAPSRRKRTLAALAAGLVGVALAVALLSQGDTEPALAPASLSSRGVQAEQASALPLEPSASKAAGDDGKQPPAPDAERRASDEGTAAGSDERRDEIEREGDEADEADEADEGDDAPSPLHEDGTPKDRPRPLGSLNKESIQEAMKTARPLLRECFDEGRKHDPSLAGRVIVEFEIEAAEEERGVVRQGSVVDSEVASPFFEACVLQKVAGLEMPVPRGGGVVKVRYPFQFDPGGGFGGEAPSGD